MVTRRSLFGFLMAGGIFLSQAPAFAEEGGGHGGSGSSGSSGSGSGDSGGNGGKDDNGGDDNGGDNGGDDHDADNDSDVALEAVKHNHAASLKEILDIVKSQHDGEVVHVSLRGNGDGLTYRIRLLDQDNRLIEVQVNAVSRRIILTKGL
jgi:Peptidase propeptide and YPEB domain